MTNFDDLLHEAFDAGAELGYIFGGEGEALTAEHLAEQFEDWKSEQVDLADISELNLLVRAHNALRREGVNTVHELRPYLDLTDFETPIALDIRGFGRGCWDDTVERLRLFDEKHGRA